MTPDWNDAPGWAQWVAMDSNGDWWWHASKPVLSNCGTWYSERSDYEPVTLDHEPICHPRPSTETESEGMTA